MFSLVSYHHQQPMISQWAGPCNKTAMPAHRSRDAAWKLQFKDPTASFLKSFKSGKRQRKRSTILCDDSYYLHLYWQFINCKFSNIWHFDWWTLLFQKVVLGRLTPPRANIVTMSVSLPELNYQALLCFVHPCHSINILKQEEYDREVYRIDFS